MRIIFLFIFCALSISGFSQKVDYSYNPVLLIPYNDHGKWGYCDTLGTIKIKPVYNEVNFFEAFHLNGQLHPYSYVETPKGMSILLPNGKLMFRKKYTLTKKYPLQIGEAKKSVFLIEKKGKLGLFLFGTGVIQRTNQDSIYNKGEVVLMKKSDDINWSRFDFSTEKLVATDIVTLTSYYDWNVGDFSLALRNDGSYYQIKDGTLSPLTNEAAQALMDDYEELFLEEVADDYGGSSFRTRSNQIPDVVANATDKILDRGDYSRISTTAAKYGFQQLYIAQKGDYQGVLNENGDIVLPFNYDKIGFSSDATQVWLTRDGKVGRKIFFTSYPIIEPKYDFLTPARNLRVSNTWTFALFRITLNEQKGFVGENSIEYFDFD